MSAKSALRRSVTLAVALAGLGLLGASAAGAATFSVATTPELEADVAKANGNAQANTIVLASATYLPKKTLTFTDTSGPQTVEGPAGSPTVIGGSAKLSGDSVEPAESELFVVNPGVSVTFKDVEITGAGGAAGQQALKDSGTLTIESSLLSGNTGASVAVERGATATVRNSTLSNSKFGLIADGTASLFNSTVVFNESGGLENAGTLNLTNTIVADNEGGDCAGKATTSDHSLDSDGSCGVGALSEMNPELAKLANDGGTTSIYSLKKGSPAIGAGDPTAGVCPATDQRGAKRKSPCSIGADEYSSTPPTIKVPAKIKTEATGPGGAVVEYTAEATGVEDVATSFSCTPESDSEFPVGETTVNCKAEDGHGNTATASFVVEVTKKGPAEPPKFSGIPANITTPATSPSGATVTYTDPTATDPAGGTDTVTCTPPSGSTFAIGTTSVACTATSKAAVGAMVTFEVTVTATPPVFSGVPANITTPATSPSGATVTYTDPTATDPAGGTDTVSCLPASGSTFKIGATTVTCSTTSKAGVKATPASFEVTVTATAPVFSAVPAKITVEATGSSGAAVTYTDPTATDPAGGTDAVTCTPPSGSTFKIGATKVICSATSKAGIKGEASFEVVVTEKTVTGPPVFSGVPANITTPATSPSGAVVTYTDPTATDPAGGTDTVSCLPASGSTFAIGTTKVICTATDKGGVKGEASFEVTVTATAPVFSAVPAKITVEATGPSGAAVTYTDPTATDPAGGTDTVTCTPPSGSTFAIGTTTVGCTATSKADVKATPASFEVVVTEKTVTGPPVFSGVPANITTPATSPSGAVVTYTDPTATDPAGGTDTVTCTPPSGSTFKIGTTTVTCSATSKGGVKAVASFKITVTEGKVSPAAAIRALLQQVSTAKIPSRIRFELTALLELALHNLGGGGIVSGYGEQPPVPVTVGLFGAQSLRAQTAQLQGLSAGRQEFECQQALDDLGLFIAVIQHDQKGRSPQIPSSLAAAWTKSAQSAAAALSCRSDNHGGSGHHHGRSGHSSGH